MKKQSKRKNRTRKCTSCGKVRVSVRNRKIYRLDDNSAKGFYSLALPYCFTCHKNLPKYEG